MYIKEPPRNNDHTPIKIKEHNLKDQVTYFICNQHTKKELGPNIHVLESIYNIKGKLMLYVMVANYTSDHVTFNKGHGKGHMEPPISNMS